MLKAVICRHCFNENDKKSIPEKLLYSAQSESFDPSSVSQLAMDYANKIIKDMAKQGLVSKK